mgnify:FL=1
MTAYPVTCLVDNEDGYRTTITVEDGDEEAGAVARLVVVFDRDTEEARIDLSPDAARAIVRDLRRRILEAR